MSSAQAAKDPGRPDLGHSVLVVEDEEDILRGIEITLKGEGYRVLSATDGETALKITLRDNPDVIILDVMLPGKSGLDVCRELRSNGVETPIIMLSAKADEVDRVVGLELGADDYVTKPFSPRELVARVRARLRRDHARKADRLEHYRFGEVEIDFLSYTATRARRPLQLTPKEYDILHMLIRHRGEVVSRDRMLDEIWGYSSYPTTRTVDNHILKLRQKLEPDPAKPRHILSIYGEGYKFVG